MPSVQEVLVQWQPVNITNLSSVFTERNSFAACAGYHKIYIYGGIEMLEQGPRTLGDFIEIDLKKLSARTIEPKGDKPPALNSSSLVYY